MCRFRCSFLANCLVQSAPATDHSLPPRRPAAPPLLLLTRAVEGSLPRVAPSVPQQVLLPGEGLPTVEAVVGPLRLDAHVQLEVAVEVLPPAVGLGTALICALQAAGRVGLRGLAAAQLQRQGGGPGLGLLQAGRGRQPQRTARPVDVTLVAGEMLLPLEILPALRTPEGSFRLLPEVGHLQHNYALDPSYYFYI